MERYFNAPMPRHSIGAVANRNTGVAYTTPARNGFHRPFLSPAVGANFVNPLRIKQTVLSRNTVSPLRKRQSVLRDLHAPQGRSFVRAVPAAAKQWNGTPSARAAGQQTYNNLLKNQQFPMDSAQNVPRPIHSLVARLAISAVSIDLSAD